MKIGVFDSGVGGLSVALAIQQAWPASQVVYMNDKDNIPYGNKTIEHLWALVESVIEEMVNQGCDVIVIACNTVSTNLAERLRARFDLPFVAMEPMVKPAAERTASKIIAVCATPATLASARYAWLKNTYAAAITVLEPDCSDWAIMIETKTTDRRKVASRITEVCEQGADVIVLACTHYHWIQKDIRTVANKYAADVIHPEDAIINRLKTVLGQLT